MYKEVDIEMTTANIRLFTSGLELDKEEDKAIVEKLSETTCRVYMLRCEESIKVSFKSLIKQICLNSRL